MAPVYPLGDEKSLSKPRTQGFVTKRAHRKSRAGCKGCKQRKIKCDESRPKCTYCKAHSLQCNYNIDVAASPGSQSSDDSSASIRTSRSSELDLVKTSKFTKSPEYVVNLFPDWNTNDVGLLNHYVATTSGSIALIHRQGANSVVGVELPRLALEHSFMKHCVLGIAALHLQHLAPDVPEYQSLAISHRVKALSGLRVAISQFSKDSFRGILAASLFILIVSSGSSPAETGDDLWIGNWLGLWAGMRQTIDMLSWEFVEESGLAPIFAKDDFPQRPLVYLPTVLSNMVLEMDSNTQDTIVILDTLKCLSKLYEYLLAKGITPELTTKILAWPPNTYISEYSTLVKQRQPQALVIAAYYLVFNKIIDKAWWLVDISSREIKTIARILPLAFQSRMIIPLQVADLTSKWDIAAMLLSQLSEVSINDDFNSPQMSLRQKHGKIEPVEEME